jgi:hypothetical protein
MTVRPGADSCNGHPRPVSAGTPLYLLAHLGWLPGRYEWGCEVGTPGRFHFRLPRAWESQSITIRGVLASAGTTRSSNANGWLSSVASRRSRPLTYPAAR